MVIRRRPNQSITLQVRASVRGTGGGQTDTWNLLRHDYAFVEDVSFRETNEAGRVAPVRAKRFKIRRDDDIDASNNRVVYAGRNYNIRDVKVDERNIRNNYTVLTATAGVAQ